MRYRSLGLPGAQTSELGIGTWQVGGEYGSFDEPEFSAAVNRALDLGVTMFDSAWPYGFGEAETLLGRALRGRRDEAIICTKVGIYELPDGTWYRDSRRTMMLGTLERSLRCLRTDHVDLLLIHWPDRSMPFDEPAETLSGIVTAGKARWIGVSNFTAEDLRAITKTGLEIVTNQIGYNLFDRRWEREVFETAQELGVGIMTYGTLAHGLLTDEVGTGLQFAANDWRSTSTAFEQDLFGPSNLAQNLSVRAELAEIAASAGLTLPQLALAWVLRLSVVSCALTGARTTEQVEESASGTGNDLDADTLARVEQAMSSAAGLSDRLPVGPGYPAK